MAYSEEESEGKKESEEGEDSPKHGSRVAQLAVGEIGHVRLQGEGQPGRKAG